MIISPNPCQRQVIQPYVGMCRYGAGKVSAGANVDGAPLPEDPEDGGKEEEVGEFGFNTLVCRPLVTACASALLPMCLVHRSSTHLLEKQNAHECKR